VKTIRSFKYKLLSISELKAGDGNVLQNITEINQKIIHVDLGSTMLMHIYLLARMQPVLLTKKKK